MMTLGIITSVVANGQMVHDPVVEVEAVLLSDRDVEWGHGSESTHRCLRDALYQVNF